VPDQCLILTLKIEKKTAPSLTFSFLHLTLTESYNLKLKSKVNI